MGERRSYRARTGRQRAVLAALVPLLAPAIVGANVFGEDRRTQRDPRGAIVRSVGMIVQPRTGGGGTAFLVSRCHVVTAYHVAFAREGSPDEAFDTIVGRIGHAVEFVVGANPRAAGVFAARSRATVVDFGLFSPRDFRGMASDWAILKLDKCLGSTYGFLEYARRARADAIPDGELMTVGFPRSRATLPGITVESGCRARDHGPVPGLVGVDCAFERGMSGGPILERQRDGGWQVVGLVQQATESAEKFLAEYAMAHRNQMVSIDVFRAALDKALRSEARRVLDERAR